MSTEQKQMIEDCKKRQPRLSDWEVGFVDSLAKQLRKGGTLSDRQLRRLEQIWDSVTELG